MTLSLIYQAVYDIIPYLLSCIWYYPLSTKLYMILSLIYQAVYDIIPYLPSCIWYYPLSTKLYMILSLIYQVVYDIIPYLPSCIWYYPLSTKLYMILSLIYQVVYDIIPYLPSCIWFYPLSTKLYMILSIIYQVVYDITLYKKQQMKIISKVCLRTFKLHQLKSIYRSLGKFSKHWIDSIFLNFPRKQDLTFHANWRQFAWINKSRKNTSHVVCWKFHPAC